MNTPRNKTRVPIEMILRWAYHDELPKENISTSFLRQLIGRLGFGGSWGSVSKVGLLGTDVQESNRFGIVPDITAQADPHPDAILVWQEVQNLAGIEVDLPEDWYPIGDLGDLGERGKAAVTRGINKRCAKDARGNVYLKTPIEQFVQHCVIMSKAPDWRAEKPELKTMRHANGSPRYFIRNVVNINGANMEIEEDGFDKTKRRPKPGAYLKEFLDPDPVDAVVARIDYRIWHSALGILVDRLEGRLDAREPVMTDQPAEPWDEGERPAPRRLLSLAGTPMLQPAVTRRSTPLAPLRGIVAPGRHIITDEDRARGYVEIDGRRMPLKRPAAE